eukprot:4644502-Pleurochrysis_carterae.AAC.1
MLRHGGAARRAPCTAALRAASHGMVVMGNLVDLSAFAVARDSPNASPSQEKAASRVRPAQAIATRCANPRCTVKALAMKVGQTTCIHLINTLLRDHASFYTENGACLEIASLYPLQCGSCAPLRSVAASESDHGHTYYPHASSPRAFSTSSKVWNGPQRPNSSNFTTNRASDRHLAAVQTLRCTDDPDYLDAGSGNVAWRCSDWVGFDCRLGGYGIETAEGIGLLVYS